ncbi:hypothetical protein [Thiolapillus sp.]|uniref:hypothetical protein n=1 Tax=Thiolapillus sp. TaxID=2017437 RepID=UPI003AF871BE
MSSEYRWGGHASGEAAGSTPLYAIIHEEGYRNRFEQLVFEVANELAIHFNLRGNGKVLHALLEAPEWMESDAEVLLRLVIETLQQWQMQDKARFIGALIETIERARRGRGVAA